MRSRKITERREQDEHPSLPLVSTRPPQRDGGCDFSFLRPLKPTVVFTSYWRFAAERQRIFLRRIRGQPGPWTADPILQVHKFTNAYRASDRASQCLIRRVIYDGPTESEETFFRIMLFKLFNRIETWELLTKAFGTVCYGEYSFERYDQVLTAAMVRGEKVYSAAYIMPSGGRGSEFVRKHQMHLRLLERMMTDELPERMSEFKRMAQGFEAFRAYPTIGDFLAYQYVTDINYSPLTSFVEDEFVMPGPGARDGIRKCFSDFGGLTEGEVIKFITERQAACFSAVGVRFPTLWGRPLQLIDCQNLFCEIDKYSRVAHPEISGLSGRTRIKQVFRPSAKPLLPWYPPKWGINERLQEEPTYVPNP